MQGKVAVHLRYTHADLFIQLDTINYKAGLNKAELLLPGLNSVTNHHRKKIKCLLVKDSWALFVMCGSSQITMVVTMLSWWLPIIAE